MAEVAHEVGTPLHSVAGHLELLRNDLASSTTGDDVTRRLTIIETQVARVIDIITRLVDVTRHASGKAAPVDVAGVNEASGADRLEQHDEIGFDPHFHWVSGRRAMALAPTWK